MAYVRIWHMADVYLKYAMHTILHGFHRNHTCSGAASFAHGVLWVGAPMDRDEREIMNS